MSHVNEPKALTAARTEELAARPDLADPPGPVWKRMVWPANPKDTNGFARVGLICGRFRSMDDDATIAAVATEDGGTSRLTYGDLRELLSAAYHAGDRLQQIAAWHTREDGPGGNCRECGQPWPCATRRTADGTTGPDDEQRPAIPRHDSGRSAGCRSGESRCYRDDYCPSFWRGGATPCEPVLHSCTIGAGFG